MQRFMRVSQKNKYRKLILENIFNKFYSPSHKSWKLRNMITNSQHESIQPSIKSTHLCKVRAKSGTTRTHLSADLETNLQPGVIQCLGGRSTGESARLKHVSNWEIFVLSRIIFGACLASKFDIRPPKSASRV